jgi:hypothetical protein
MALLRLKSGSLAAGPPSLTNRPQPGPNDAEAQFGPGLTLQTIGQAGGNVDKLGAAERDPSVVDRFHKYGVSEPDLMTYDTEPAVLAGPSEGRIRPLIPKIALARDLGGGASSAWLPRPGACTYATSSRPWRRIRPCLARRRRASS